MLEAVNTVLVRRVFYCSIAGASDCSPILSEYGIQVPFFVGYPAAMQVTPTTTTAAHVLSSGDINDDVAAATGHKSLKLCLFLPWIWMLSIGGESP